MIVSTAAALDAVKGARRGAAQQFSTVPASARRDIRRRGRSSTCAHFVVPCVFLMPSSLLEPRQWHSRGGAAYFLGAPASSQSTSREPLGGKEPTTPFRSSLSSFARWARSRSDKQAIGDGAKRVSSEVNRLRWHGTGGGAHCRGSRARPEMSLKAHAIGCSRRARPVLVVLLLQSRRREIATASQKDASSALMSAAFPWQEGSVGPARSLLGRLDEALIEPCSSRRSIALGAAVRDVRVFARPTTRSPADLFSDYRSRQHRAGARSDCRTVWHPDDPREQRRHRSAAGFRHRSLPDRGHAD